MLHYIAAKSKAAWRKCSKIILKDNWTWVKFEQFLLNHIKNPQNQHLAVSKCYAETKQRPKQKTSDFVNYFVSLEYNFEELLKSMCHDNFLNKMQKELYDKIVANQQIPGIWKTLIFLATRLKAQLPGISREPFKHRTSQPQEIHSDNSGTSSETKFKNWQQESKPWNQKRWYSRALSKHNKQTHKNLNTNAIICYQCHKKEHISKDCQNPPLPHISSTNSQEQKKNSES